MFCRSSKTEHSVRYNLFPATILQFLHSYLALNFPQQIATSWEDVQHEIATRNHARR